MPVAQSSSRSTSVVAVRIDSHQATELYQRSGASAYSLSLEQFAEILQRVVSRTEEMSGADAEKVANFLSGLKLDELALAHGCAAGNQHAWDVFLTRYREDRKSVV